MKRGGIGIVRIVLLSSKPECGKRNTQSYGYMRYIWRLRKREAKALTPLSPLFPHPIFFPAQWRSRDCTTHTSKCCARTGRPAVYNSFVPDPYLDVDRKRADEHDVRVGVDVVVGAVFVGGGREHDRRRVRAAECVSVG